MSCRSGVVSPGQRHAQRCSEQRGDGSGAKISGAAVGARAAAMTHTVHLEALLGDLSDGSWRRSMCDYAGRFEADLAVRFAPATQGEDSAMEVQPVVISQSARAAGGWHKGDPMTTGSTVWDSAPLLLAHLQAHRGELAGRRVVELGAGTGLVGLGAHRLGAVSVMLTDLPSMEPLLRRNVERNGGGRGVMVQPLVWQQAEEEDWIHSGHTYDFVLMSDLLYHAEASEPLFKVLAALARHKRSSGPLRCFWAQELHQPQLFQSFRAALELAGWVVTELRSFGDCVGEDVVLCELCAPLGSMSQEEVQRSHARTWKVATEERADADGAEAPVTRTTCPEQALTAVFCTSSGKRRRRLLQRLSAAGRTVAD